MFVFQMKRENPDDHFVLEERHLVLKAHGLIWLNMQRYLWDYLEISAQAACVPLPDRVEQILNQALHDGSTGPDLIWPIRVHFIMSYHRVNRMVHGHANDDGDGDIGPTVRFQFPDAQRYRRGLDASLRARRMLANNLAPRLGKAGLRTLLPDLDAKRFTCIKRIRANHRPIKPNLVY
jgi:hypothetical protein